MRNRIYILAAWVVLLASACSKDYLSTSPEDEATTPVVFATTEAAAMAVNGIAKIMNTPFYYPNAQAPASSDFNGEGTIKMIYGNWMGNHFVCSNKDGYSTLFKGTNYMSQTSSPYCFHPWWYYYMVIGNANEIVCNIEGAEGLESERQRILAQALTFRAHAYTMLSQLYCKRWADSDEGKADGLVLRLDNTIDGQKLCTLKELYGQIYDDLDEAVRLFKASGYERQAKQNQLPDIHVAYAVYARAALVRKDYAVASPMARAAKEGFALMNEKEYGAGFNVPNSEWIWSSRNTGEESIGQFSFLSKITYNSTLAEAGKTKCISRELLDRIPASDMRRNLFLDPGGLSYSATGLAGAELKAKALALYPDISTKVPVYAYMQFKFKGTDNSGGGDLNHIRASEMLLIEAEAEFFLKNEPTVREALIALNKDSGRDKSYDCTKSGQALLDEIKLYRAVELWGEGFDWFDMKRWGDSIDRKPFDKGGNFTVKTGFTTTPDENNGWCWLIPDFESDFNPQL